jgi:hypothetical protein
VHDGRNILVDAGFEVGLCEQEGDTMAIVLNLLRVALGAVLNFDGCYY